MTPLHVLVLLLLAVSGTMIVFQRDPLHALLVASLYNSVLIAFFLVFQAPDVAMSQVAVTSLPLALVYLLTLAKERARR